METSSSSKVTVEYHDPSGVFPLVSRDITARLPLRNLNWQSATRPLRQIKSLHLDLVPDSSTRNGFRPQIERAESDTVTSLDIVRSGADTQKNAAKERRHQIPGLQTSPYLRIYVLRCDDKDAYKASERQKVKDWIRDIASSNTKSRGKSANHDASEWLILHVVIPDTVAASQPRWRESSKDDEELKERKKGVKLPGKSSRTVFDKLRADFNDSGKSAQDRVAQIRISKDQLPADLLPTPPQATTLEETFEEREKAWNDLMSKLRTLILDPFDKRVRQYEADIQEQEARRSMPGFNFCTFFTYKEGLAKALESIGLVEDALVIYDELSLGLETILKDIANGKAEGTATRFAPFTDDIKDRIIGARRPATNGASASDHVGGETTEILERDYRDKIMRSNISIFDFVSYLFSRQKALILRLANAKSARAELGTVTKEGGEDLVLISEVCWRASSFIHNNARTLRRDLVAHRQALWESKAETVISDADVESVVCSWTYTMAGQILDDTASSTLDQALDPSRRESLANGTATSPRRMDFHGPGLGGVHAYPLRTSSLAVRQSRVLELASQSKSSLQSGSETDLISPPSSSDGPKPPTAGVPGMVELVSYRAELFMIRRKMLEALARQRSWRAGWASLNLSQDRMVDVDLDDAKENAEAAEQPEPSALLTPTLVLALETKESFHTLYETLSDHAMRLYLSATQTKSAESIMGDLAILKFQQGDYGYAISYFQHVLPLYAADGWRLMEAESLRMQAKALKALDRNEEYVKCLLQLVARVCDGRKRIRDSIVDEDLDVGDVQGILPDLVAFSEALKAPVTSSAESYFRDIRLNPEVLQHDERDGFSLTLSLHHLLDETIQLDEVSARLVNEEDPNQEIWLERASSFDLKPGANEIALETSTVAWGSYVVDGIMLRAKNLQLVHEFQRKAESGQLVLNGAEKSDTASIPQTSGRMFVYPAKDAFNAGISLARNVHINAPRHLNLTLNSGWNQVQSVDLRVRPASAGLRLHLAEANSAGIHQREEAYDSKQGQISLGRLDKFSIATVQVPYSLEQAAHEIYVRLEVRYRTSNGSSTFLTASRLQAELPLDVDVNDVFHIDALFSNFTVRTMNRTPLSITEATLAPSAAYDVEAPPVLPMPMTVFDRQPVKLVYKILRREAKGTTSRNKKDVALSLKVQYLSMEEVIVKSIEKTFAQALDESPFADLSRLLVPLLAQQLRKTQSEHHVEMATLLAEARIPSYEGAGWQATTATLPGAIQPALTGWLKCWHNANDRVALVATADMDELQRSITISVDVPNVDFVHQASLSLLGRQQRPFAQSPKILSLGQPIKAQLKLISTSIWSSNATFHSDDAKATPNFVFDVQADVDTWLVGGQRRAHFIAREGEELTFDLTLIPLKLGTYGLLNVDVQPAQVTANLDSANSSSELPPVSCETLYASAGQVVQVIRDVRTSRVHIAESDAAATLAQPQSRPSTSTAMKDGS